jgi:predicted alpha/beta hydrolase family esterase
MGNTVVIVPGLRKSGPFHWQQLWRAKNPAYLAVTPPEQDPCKLERWVGQVDRAIAQARGKAVLVAHGYGCLAAMRRIARHSGDVAAVMLVAPANPEKFSVHIPGALDVPATLVASRDDPWFAFENAMELAWRLGAKFVDAGAAGHIDEASGHGAWPEGEQQLNDLRARAIQCEEVIARLAMSAAV